MSEIADLIKTALQIRPWSPIQKWWRRRTTRIQVTKYLKTLSSNERFILAYCLNQNQQSIKIGRVSSAADSLASKGLLEVASTAGLYNVYNVPQMVWDQLKKHQAEVFPESFLRDMHTKRALEQIDANQEDPLAGPDF